MKKILAIIVVIALGLGGYFGWKSMNKTEEDIEISEDTESNEEEKKEIAVSNKSSIEKVKLLKGNWLIGEEALGKLSLSIVDETRSDFVLTAMQKGTDANAPVAPIISIGVPMKYTVSNDTGENDSLEIKEIAIDEMFIEPLTQEVVQQLSNDPKLREKKDKNGQDVIWRLGEKVFYSLKDDKNPLPVDFVTKLKNAKIKIKILDTNSFKIVELNGQAPDQKLGETTIKRIP